MTVRATVLVASAALGGVGLAGLLSACSTVKSIDLTTAEPPQRAGAYLNYSVAKSFFTIQVAAASASSTKPPSPSATPAPAAGGATATAQSTTWTLSGSLTAAPAGAASPGAGSTPGGSGAGGSGAGASQPPDATLCGALTADYTAAQTQVAAAIAVYSTVKLHAAKMASGATDSETPKLLSAEAAKYVATLRTGAYKAALEDDGQPPGPDGHRLPKNYDAVVAACPTNVTVSIQQSVVPDITRTFALKARTNVFYADALTFNTDANGFLTNGAPTASSQVTAIASAVANDVGLFSPIGPVPALREAVAGAAPPVALIERPLLHQRGKPSKPVPSKHPCEAGSVPYLDDQIADLASCKDVASAEHLAALLLGDLPKPGSLPNLPSAALPMTIYASIEDLPSSADPAPATYADTATRLAPFKLSLSLDCSPRNGAVVATDGVPENPVDPDDYDRPTKTGVYDGLVVSASRACRFTAKQQRPLTDPPPKVSPPPLILAQSYLWAQDSRYLTVLPTQRGFLVARSVAYQFANGQATGVTDSRPSELLAAVSLPSAVVGSFFSGVSTAFTNSQTITNGKTADLTAQTNYLTAQTNYLAAQAALKTAKQPPSGP